MGFTRDKLIITAILLVLDELTEPLQLASLASGFSFDAETGSTSLADVHSDEPPS